MTATLALTSNLTAEEKLFRNLDVLSGSAHAFAAYYTVGLDQYGRRVLLLNGQDAGITMKPIKGFNVWQKSDFQKLAKRDVAGDEMIARAMRDFNAANYDELMKMRTVGCGTFVVLNLADGLFPVLIKRTQTVDVGSVNPDAYTRPAGGSTGSVDDTAMRELNEELYVRFNNHGTDTMLHIVPDGYQVSATAMEEIRNERRNRMDSVISAHNTKNNVADMDPALIRAHLELKTPMIAVPGLTEDVIERTDHNGKTLLNRVFCDQASVMDVNGIDGITVVNLPWLSSQQITGLYDGEMSQKGEFLSRQVELWTFDRIEKALVAADKQSGKITMSPTPRKTAEAFIGQNAANQALLLAAA